MDSLIPAEGGRESACSLLDWGVPTYFEGRIGIDLGQEIY